VADERGGGQPDGVEEITEGPGDRVRVVAEPGVLDPGAALSGWIHGVHPVPGREPADHVVEGQLPAPASRDEDDRRAGTCNRVPEPHCSGVCDTLLDHLLRLLVLPIRGLGLCPHRGTT
jgi:hypothetical protein